MPVNISKAALHAFLLFSAINISGCAYTTTFTSYTGKMNPIINQLKADGRIESSQLLISESKGADTMLYSLERGRIAQIQDELDSSIASYEHAMAAIRASDEKAVISVSGTFSQASALLTNDNAIPYQGEGYERVMLHNLQAMNYLARKDVEAAGVEIRRANAEQEEALKRHDMELADAREDAEKYKFSSEEGANIVNGYLPAMDELVGQVKNSFQNAYSFYVSGFVYELLKQPNDAYIDYKKALEIQPGNPYLQQDVIRLARSLGMIEDLDQFKSLFQATSDSLNSALVPPDLETGEVLLFFEDDFVPQKEQVKIPLPVPGNGIIAIAFPIYRQAWSDLSPISVLAGADLLGVTAPLVDARALAVKALTERIPAMVTRQVIRAVAKGVAARKSRDKLGSLGEFSLTLYNLLSENADLRSWNTLPARVQLVRGNLPVGKHTLSLQQQDGNVLSDLEIDVNNGSRTIVRVIRAGNMLRTTTIKF